MKQFKSSSDGGKTYSPWKTPSTPKRSMNIRYGSDEKGQYFIDLEDDTKYYKW